MGTFRFTEPRLWTMGMEGNEEEIEESDKDDRSSAMLSLLRHISTYSTHFHDTFIDLMTEINLTGYTPFMAAVACKVWGKPFNYTARLIIFISRRTALRYICWS